MRRYILYPFILLVIVGGFLTIRKWVDRKVEKANDMEVVREGEEYLGSWASKSATGLVQFRLRRNGEINYTVTTYPQSDTVKINGKYEILTAPGGRNVQYYPRLLAISDKGDTIFNYFIAYITSYGSTVDKTDKMILNRNNRYDTTGYIFYRIKQ